VVKYAALLVMSIVAFQCSDVPGEGREPPRGYTETITFKSGEKISFKMVPVPGGTFLMGSPEDQPGRKDDEGPQHEVRLAPFYLCTTETTLELFLAYYSETMSAKKDYIEAEQARKDAEQSRNDVDAITGPTPVYGDLTMGYEKNHPAMGMTWHNAMTFCKWVSRKTGRTYRLPTEAEWEYACRAGTTNVFGFGNDPNQSERSPGDDQSGRWPADFAWYEANSDGQNHGVGKKKPNAWGLYDMLGNVREWVYDFYSPEAYSNAANKSPTVNPRGPTRGKVHVTRGGDYNSSIEELRCAARAFEEKWWRLGDPQIPKSTWWLPEMDFIGFRIARSFPKRERLRLGDP
jgi:formylglycine-generating enzyme required for sulfatase activity